MDDLPTKFSFRVRPTNPGPLIHSREAAEKQQREAEKQQREAEKQQREAAERLRQEEERKKQQQAVSQHFAESMRLMQQKVGDVTSARLSVVAAVCRRPCMVRGAEGPASEATAAAAGRVDTTVDRADLDRSAGAVDVAPSQTWRIESACGRVVYRARPPETNQASGRERRMARWLVTISQCARAHVQL